MKTIFTVLLAIILFPALSFAQRNYKPGYVVTLKGDTLKGLIDYRGWDISPSTIRFQPYNDLKPMKLTVRDINFFSLNKIGKYQRYIGLISLDNTSQEHMIEYRDTSYKLDTIFLRILEKGKNIALYSYADALKDRYFVGQAPDYKPVELGYRLYWNGAHVDKSKSTGRTVYENTYMRQLFDLAVKYNAASNGVKKDIEQSQYMEVYLVDIARAINKGSN